MAAAIDPFDVREAVAGDLDGLIEVLSQLADGRSTALPADRAASRRVLELILSDPSRHLLVAVSGERVLGTVDVAIMQNLTHRGTPRAIVENVVVADDARRRGVAAALMRRAIEIARSAGCSRVQLMSGRQRTEAHAFYRSIGMEPVAEGFKIRFDS